MDAACLQASARAGRAVAVDGPLNTTMAGLRNREVSPLAFESLLPNVDGFMAIGDAWAHQAMRALAAPMNGDGTIAAGASGAAALGGLMALCRDESMNRARRKLGLDSSSRVLVIVSEGVTDPDLWRSVVSAT
jgi:diaminopropionate ammonia-lyase